MENRLSIFWIFRNLKIPKPSHELTENLQEQRTQQSRRPKLKKWMQN